MPGIATDVIIAWSVCLSVRYVCRTQPLDGMRRHFTETRLIAKQHCVSQGPHASCIVTAAKPLRTVEWMNSATSHFLAMLPGTK